jgi:phytoene/squalene synthetase
MGILEPLKALEYCEREVKKNDMASYIHGLFLPSEIRPFFYTVHAFRLEMVKAREQIHHTTLISTKESWWLDNLEQIWNNNPAEEPISISLNELRKYHVTRKSHFERMVQGSFDHSSIKSWRSFDRFIDNNFTMCSYAIVDLLHMFKEPEFLAATYAGRAWGVMELLLRTKYYSDHGRYYFPQDLLEKYNLPLSVAVEDTKISSNVIPEGFFDVILEVAAYGRNNLQKAREMKSELPKYAYLAFLNLQFAEEFYERLEKQNFDVFRLQKNMLFWPKIAFRIASAVRKKGF